jgi:hypothetical protein
MCICGLLRPVGCQKCWDMYRLMLRLSRTACPCADHCITLTCMMLRRDAGLSMNVLERCSNSLILGVVVLEIEGALRPVGCICTACLCTGCSCPVLFFLPAWPDHLQAATAAVLFSRSTTPDGLAVSSVEHTHSAVLFRFHNQSRH